MDYEYILVEQRGPALWVTLNRPAALNSLSLALAEELAAAIEAADTEIGRLLVEAEIDLSNTTIIVLGDNGSVRDMAVGPFDPLRAKFSIYEGGINVPLIIAGDSVNYPNRESAALVNTSDLFTTVFELAGGDPSVLPVPRHGSPDHDSFSLVPILSDDCNGGCSVESIREYAYAEIVWQMDNGKAIRNRAGYKLKYDGAALPKKWELFYLDDDPFEETDLVVSYNPTTGELLTSPELQPILDDLLAKVGAGGEPPDFPAANLDQDADATADASDNCSVDSNPNQDDSDGDLCGNQCDADYNQDNVVSILDFGTFASCFNGPVQGICDHAPETLDGVVSILDFGVFRQQYTAGVPGPGQSTLCDGQ